MFINFTYASEINNCNGLKKFSKEHMSCLAKNLKKIALKGTNKVKKDVNIAAGEVKEDATKVKDKTEKLIEKGKEKIN